MEFVFRIYIFCKDKNWLRGLITTLQAANTQYDSGFLKIKIFSIYKLKMSLMRHKIKLKENSTMVAKMVM